MQKIWSAYDHAGCGGRFRFTQVVVGRYIGKCEKCVWRNNGLLVLPRGLRQWNSQRIFHLDDGSSCEHFIDLVEDIASPTDGLRIHKSIDFRIEWYAVEIIRRSLPRDGGQRYGRGREVQKSEPPTSDLRIQSDQRSDRRRGGGYDRDYPAPNAPPLSVGNDPAPQQAGGEDETAYRAMLVAIASGGIGRGRKIGRE